jgi:hypothetical protein
MQTVTELARHWGTSHQYVSQKVKQGCPLDSFEAADLWRQANQVREPRKRMPVAPEVNLEPIPISPEDSTFIPLATAKDIAFRGYDFILDLVDRLPKNTAAQCNPGNPQIAFDVLESECTYIVCKAYEAYAAWSKVGAQISTATDEE